MPPLSNDGLPAELLQEIATRLRPVCSDIPESQFALLVQEVAVLKLRHDPTRMAATRKTG
jgi:hypothetical protein